MEKRPGEKAIDTKGRQAGRENLADERVWQDAVQKLCLFQL